MSKGPTRLHYKFVHSIFPQSVHIKKFDCSVVTNIFVNEESTRRRRFQKNSGLLDSPIKRAVLKLNLVRVQTVKSPDLNVNNELLFFYLQDKNSKVVSKQLIFKPSFLFPLFESMLISHATLYRYCFMPIFF